MDIQGLRELNAEYYSLFNDLFDAAPALPERHYTTVAKVLEQQYLEDLDIYLTERAISVGVENFGLKFRAKNYLPRRVFLCWNKMAKALLNDYRAEFKEFLDKWAISKKDQHKPIQDVKDDDSSQVLESTALTVREEKAVTPSEGNNDGA